MFSRSHLRSALALALVLCLAVPYSLAASTERGDSLARAAVCTPTSQTGLAIRGSAGEILKGSCTEHGADGWLRPPESVQHRSPRFAPKRPAVHAGRSPLASRPPPSRG